MNKFNNIFKSYSDVMNREMDRYLQKIEQDYDKGPRNFDKEPQDSDIEGALNKILKDWLDTPQDEAGGLTPREYIEGIDILEEAVEALKSFLLVGEGIVPDVLGKKLEEFGEAAVGALLDLLSSENKANFQLDENLQENADDEFQPYFYVKQGIITLMGIWKAERSIPALIKVIRNSNDEDEFLAETSVKALVEIGVQSVPSLIEEAGKSEGKTLDYMMDALTLIGSEEKDSRIYPVVKEYFLKSGNSDMALIFLMQLNDSRAITFLRGYIQKNANTVSYREYSSLKRCVEELGGSTEDIAIDFSNDPEYQQYMKMISKYRDLDEANDSSKTAAGRNDPCPCGSGKKFKKCCGK